MKVVVDSDTDSIGVYLDNGSEVGRYCVVDDSTMECELMARMIQACIDETVPAKYIALCIAPKIEFEEGSLKGGPIEIAEGLALAYEAIVQTLRTSVDRLKAEAAENERRG